MLFATDWVELTAIATFVLGFVTLLLVLVTRSMVKKAGEEIAIERRRIDEATKPRVFPAPHSLWGDDYGRGSEFVSVGGWRSVLPVTNGGPGVALNVRAQLRWEGGMRLPYRACRRALALANPAIWSWSGGRHLTNGTT